MNVAMVKLMLPLTVLSSWALLGCQIGGAEKANLAGATSTSLNVPANSCEIYVEKIAAAESSHSQGSLRVKVRVPWLGSGEQVQAVGFYGRPSARDLGNDSSCHAGPEYNDTNFTVRGPTQGGDTQLGEYEFDFPVHTGSVLSQCPGYSYSWMGTFYVQTNFKTYWVNPNMSPSQYFTFDDTLWDHTNTQFGIFNWVNTVGSNLTFYNPRACVR